MSTSQFFAGRDVAKAQLDFALRPTGERWAVTSAETGMAALVVRLQAMPPTLMVCEATGRNHQAVVAALAAAAWPSIGVTPRQVRDVAHATGQWATTEGLDAHAVAYCTQAVRPVPRPRPDAQTAELRALLAWRRQGMALRIAEQNRLEQAPRRLRADPETPIAWLDQRVAALDDLDTTRRASPVWRERETMDP